MAIPNIGLCVPTVEEFLDYLDDVKPGAWRARGVTLHHTGDPDRAVWDGWQTRARPVSDSQWMQNLAVYYGSAPPNGPADGPWRSGPHFFVTPKNFCVLSPPDKRGVHARSFNANFLGMEVVGDFDSEPFEGLIRDRTVDALAAVHIAFGLQPDPYERGVRGLHFHRDDPLTKKSCPGKHVLKAPLIEMVKARMLTMTGGDGPEDKVVVSTVPVPGKDRVIKRGVVNISDLNVRASASAKAPAVGKLQKGAPVDIVQEAMNGATKWYGLAGGTFVAARYVDLVK